MTWLLLQGWSMKKDHASPKKSFCNQRALSHTWQMILPPTPAAEKQNLQPPPCQRAA
jgi:hypothetical protein